ncbi:uncharacterized protein LOC131211611 [Anopheles bellator]|uniref:uncharacterized protein LOC131211611 n=1 Tax=Anopheles bellator TaxID=139047 RepID=UPI0026492177|nr:uncharacterized protein LOC131211611 [Anopheles bellator]
MTSFALPVVLLLAVFGASLAQRDTSLRVIDALREVNPAFRDLRNQVVNAVASAKLNSSEVVYKFNVEVATRKESFLNSAISAEAGVLRQVNGQSLETDTSCLGFLRQSVDVNMNLAGVSFTNCLNTVDSTLSSEIVSFYNVLQVNETSYVNLSVYDVFRGQNVFVNPQTIIDRLMEKLSALQQAPVELVQELSELVQAFEARLSDIRAAYEGCLSQNDQLLQSTLNTVLLQLQQICLGVLLPADPTDVPSEPTTDPSEETEPAETEPAETVPTEPEPAETEPAETEPTEAESENPHPETPAPAVFRYKP